MTAEVGSAKTILKADATLLAFATGGIYDLDDTKRKGINRSNTATAAAFLNGIMQPCILLAARGELPMGGLADEKTGVMSQRGVLVVDFFQDNGFDKIDAMRLRVRTLLNHKQLTGTHRCLWMGDSAEGINLEMDTNTRRSEFAVWRVR